MKAVSLLPSGTEILCSLGVEPAAVSHECDYPPSIADKPVITETNIQSQGLSSLDINNQVYAERMDEGIYSIKEDLLGDIDPDVIVTQGICDVCAVETTDVEKVLERTGIDAEVVSLHPHCIEDILQEIETLGDTLDRTEEASQVTSNLEERIQNIKRKTRQLETPSVTIIEWMEPVIIAGHWAPEIVEIAGGDYHGCNPGKESRRVEWSKVLEMNPDRLVVSPCGFTVNQTISNLSELAARDGYSALSAVINDQVYVMDGDSYMNRAGPRIVDSVEYMAMALHPDVFGEPPSHVVQRPIKIR